MEQLLRTTANFCSEVIFHSELQITIRRGFWVVKVILPPGVYVLFDKEFAAWTGVET